MDDNPRPPSSDAPLGGSEGLAAAYLRNRDDPEAALQRARRWAEENADAIKAYNERVEREGCFGDAWRNW